MRASICCGGIGIALAILSLLIPGDLGWEIWFIANGFNVAAALLMMRSLGRAA